MTHVSPARISEDTELILAVERNMGHMIRENKNELNREKSEWTGEG